MGTLLNADTIFELASGIVIIPSLALSATMFKIVIKPFEGRIMVDLCLPYPLKIVS
jgi:hypothetical protein